MEKTTKANYNVERVLEAVSKSKVMVYTIGVVSDPICPTTFSMATRVNRR